MKIAVGTTGSKHLAASHSTDIFVGLGFDLAAQAQYPVNHIAVNAHSQNAAGNCED
jgi:hypothetical protein